MTLKYLVGVGQLNNDHHPLDIAIIPLKYTAVIPNKNMRLFMMLISKSGKTLLRCVFPALVISAAPVAQAQIVLPQQEENCSLCHFASPPTAANLIVNEVDSCDYSDADQFNGWGWNNAANSSCPPLDSPAVAGAYAHDESETPSSGNETASGESSTDCDYSNAGSSNGWGWNDTTNTSCPPVDSANDTQTNVQDDEPAPSSNGSSTPVCLLARSDPDNDGWGWENNGSCIAGADEDPTGNGGAVCDDPDGDGWGWDGRASCQVSVTDDPVETDPVAAVCLDPDGDGYGWNGFSSCAPGVAAPAAPDHGGCIAPANGTTMVSTTGPVRSTGNAFYPDNGPQCVAPASQFNGPGLGFGDFLLLNNAWNGDKSSWDWTQCISLSATNGGSVIPSWDYDWGDEDALQPGFQEWEVKSYPEVIYGVKSESVESAACETTGLPVPYGAMPSIDIDYSYRSTETNNRIGDFGDENNYPETVTGGDRNIAIESFLHSSCDIQRGASSNIEFELMVWLEHGNERLPTGGAPVSVYTDSHGSKFDVYVKGDDYIAYVAQNEVRNGTINWNEFFSHADSNASSYGIKTLDDDWCLANVIFGSEIWWGQGTFDLDYYQITRQY